MEAPFFSKTSTIFKSCLSQATIRGDHDLSTESDEAVYTESVNKACWTVATLLTKCCITHAFNLHLEEYHSASVHVPKSLTTGLYLSVENMFLLLQEPFQVEHKDCFGQQRG